MGSACGVQDDLNLLRRVPETRPKDEEIEDSVLSFFRGARLDLIFARRDETPDRFHRARFCTHFRNAVPVSPRDPRRPA
eukprot:13419549-Heterocapsa_arctica.AAC.1